jgi:predicted nucleotidyltransferase
MARARAALDRCPELLEVRLFGSLARGDAAPGSDADLLVELAESRLTFLERIASLQPLFGAVGLGVDLLPYTTAELDALRREANPLLRAAQAEGIVLARRGAPPPTR